MLYRGGSRDFEKWGVLYVGYHGQETKKILGFKWSKYFYQYFQMFSIFMYHESLPMKSYQFFKIYKRFDKEGKKTLIQQSMIKENRHTGKAGPGILVGLWWDPRKTKKPGPGNLKKPEKRDPGPQKNRKTGTRDPKKPQKIRTRDPSGTLVGPQKNRKPGT